MILVVESGATKTDWRILEQSGAVDSINTEGINPFHQSYDEILTIITSSDLPSFTTRVKKIYYYGAGCNYPEQVAKVETAITAVFPHSDINVTHDLLAAARASCGNEEGIACILGTGSNSCLYNGYQIITSNPSLGYILGDEGSGAYLGKRLLSDFMFKKVPKSIWNSLIMEYDLNISEILERIYSRQAPHKYLASFAPFLKAHEEHPYIHGMIYECFYDFVDRHIRTYDKHKDLPINFVGSIAFHFEGILRKVVLDSGMTFGKVAKNPITGLVNYHQKMLMK